MNTFWLLDICDGSQIKRKQDTNVDFRYKNLIPQTGPLICYRLSDRFWEIKKIWTFFERNLNTKHHPTEWLSIQYEQLWAGPFQTFSPSWHIALNVGNVTVPAVLLRPLLYRSCYNFLRKPLGIVQQNRIDPCRVLFGPNLWENKNRFLSSLSLPAIRFLRWAGVLSRLAALGLHASHDINNVAFVCKHKRERYKNGVGFPSVGSF